MSWTRKLWAVLLPDERRSAAVLLGLMLVGMLLETLGIGLVIPALALMTQSDIARDYPALAPWLNRLGNPSHERLIAIGMLALVAVHVVKALFLAFLAWRQARFVFGLQANLSQRLFAGYLFQPYTFHLQRNSAQLIRTAIGEVSEITNVVQQGLMLITEILVLFGISVLLLAVEPVGALLVVTTLGLAGWSFIRLTRSRLLRWGKTRQYHEGLRIQHLQQGLGGVKDVKILGRESNFIAQYQQHNIISARVAQYRSAFQQLPRLWLETLAVIGLAALVLVMMQQGKAMLLLPTLGVFAAAAFRLMPSVHRALGSFQSIRYGLPVIDHLHEELRLMTAANPSSSSKPLAFNQEIALDRIGFRYPSAETAVLQEINLSIPHGASFGFIGDSGAGKSTLVDIVLGLLTPVSGSVKVDGVDVQGRLRDWQNLIGYVPQSIFLTDDTLRRNVAFGLPDDQIDEEAVLRAIRAAQLEQFINGLPDGLNTMVGERGVRLSGGQRQRIGIARALYHDPAVLVLDEATSSLDTDTEAGVMESVRALRGNKTVLIVAHRLTTVAHCDRLFRLKEGRLIEERATLAALPRTAKND